jgi:enoyl-CoA hydratase/carnithine racemase
MIDSVKSGTVQWLAIDRQAKRNALDFGTARALTEAFRCIDSTSDLRAVVLTGRGERAFCAGGDLEPAADGSPFRVEPHNPDHFFAELLRAIDACPVPVVGRVNGSAYGGGMGLIAACDITVGVAEARFGVPEAKVGVFPFMVMPLLLRAIPYREFVAMAFTGDQIDAARAQQIGLLHEVVSAEELDAAVDRVLSKIMACSPTALRLGKHAMRQARDMRTGDALALMQSLLPLSALTQDAKEGLRAFSERRTPVWSGR